MTDSEPQLALHAGTGPGRNAVAALAADINPLLADVFTLYVMTKNFHWHVSGPRFSDLHRLMDEQADQLFAMVDPLAERVRKLGARTLGSLAEILAHRRLAEAPEGPLTAREMLLALLNANRELLGQIRHLRSRCEALGDVGTVSLLDGWIDQAEGRIWFLDETAAPSRDAGAG